MSKGKPRHDPNKKQNQYGFWCGAAEEFNSGLNCELYGKKQQLYARVIHIIAVKCYTIMKQLKVI